MPSTRTYDVVKVQPQRRHRCLRGSLLTIRASTILLGSLAIVAICVNNSIVLSASSEWMMV